MTLQPTSDGSAKRPYRSPRREKQARDTRVAILDAAQDLFIEGGYAGTSVRSIAERAGISEQTVYNAYGDKPSVLRGVIERVVFGEDDPSDHDELEMLNLVEAEPDRRKRVAILVAMTRQVYERGIADLAEVLLEGAAIDDDLANLAHDLETQRYQEMRRDISLVLGDDIPKGWTIDELVDLAWTLESISVYRHLVIDRNWTVEQYESRMMELFSSLLFDD